MTRKILVSFLAALMSTLLQFAHAQSPAKIPRIGYLTAGGPGYFPEQYLREGLRELGYVDGKNLLIEPRYSGDPGHSSNDRMQRLQQLADELVRLKVDIIVTAATDSSLAAQKATRTIPIVGGLGADPVGAGLVASFARPGGNITGIASTGAATGAKRLELLKEISPKTSLVAVLWLGGTRGGHALQMKEIESAARALSLRLQPATVRDPDDFERVFADIRKGGADSLVVLGHPMFYSKRAVIAHFATKSRLQAIYTSSPWVDAGGLISYGPNYREQMRRQAYYVDRIVKGAKPADLPVEAPTKFELVVNLKAAKQIGLTIPSSVLNRADRVIPDK